ncbi:hypothetical protein KVG88_23045 [Pseudomonas sp. SWRI74]|jgi:hypothetical protein|uniref:Uncharacterized protein n=2 Tax=Pseudomonas TaxID=286 RepID=A0A5E7FF80_PSEFL|nr:MULTISPECIES: hypothetical protein [Pseudomonas]MBV4522948.1 hypothetical protein [Pseudomonas azerbaijanoccidentalis]MCK8663659.1 hypothetical protein [Pseudomonas azerbaijanoccidentalis]VVO37564.1 hypothetical protein PS712_05532 [Pseudomonas fluorescens]
MSLSVGFPSASVINIGGKAPSTVEALSDASAETSTQRLGLEGDDKKTVSLGGGTQGSEKAESAGSQQSIAVQMLLKRMQELQQQLREQQQQLAATQAASFQSAEAKATAVMSIQAQIADTSAALMQVAAALAKELTGSGNVVSTTA